MTNEERKVLIQYRLAQANTEIQEIKILIDNQLLNIAVSRILLILLLWSDKRKGCVDKMLYIRHKNLDKIFNLNTIAEYLTKKLYFIIKINLIPT